MPKRRAHFVPPAYSAARPGLVRPVPVDPTGAAGPTARQTRGPRWRRAGRGLYVPASVDPGLPQQRVLEAAAHLPAYGVVTGWAALAWIDDHWFDGVASDGRLLPVPLAVPNHRIDAPRGAMLSAERMAPGERFVLDGMPLTAPVRSVAFEMRHASGVRAAVRAFDLAAYSDLVSIAEMTEYAESLSGWTGIIQMRDALLLADENVLSPAEVDLRLHWVIDLGLPRPLTNQPIFDLDGHHVGTPDLLDLDLGVAVEYDGPVHLQGRQRAKDLRREADLRRVGLEYVTMVGADRRDPTDFDRRVTDARSRAGRRPRSERRWTISPPAWWTPTVTVAQRRALADWQRERYLRNRVA